jgi:hypothetical protein
MILSIVMFIFIILSVLFVFSHLVTDDAKKEYIDDIYLEINKRGLK